MNDRDSADARISTFESVPRVRSTWMIASAPAAIGAPVMVRIAVPGSTRRVGIVPAPTVSITSSDTGCDSAGGGDVSGADRIAVHRGIIEAGNIARRADLLGEHATEAGKNRHALDAERCDIFENNS